MAVLASVLALGCAPAAAHGHSLELHSSAAQVTGSAAAMQEPCPGDPIEPDRVVTGDFGQDVEGGYVFVPFDVPRGTTAVRVKYCYDQPDTPLSSQINHTIDLGLYGPRDSPTRPWGPSEFRGWGGSSHPDVTVSAQGFSTEEEYLADPKGHVPGRTTRGFRPGPIEPGVWAVELGVPAVVSQAEGDLDGRVAWRVELELSHDPAFGRDPYVGYPYRTRPVKRRAGWYAGDMHVHGEHSALGDATMSELFDFAFTPRPDGAGLDWLTLSDYVSGSSWAEVGRWQRSYRDRLIVRSAEVITYRGHLNSHGNSVNMDYRAGPLYELEPDGSVRQVRDPQPPRHTFERIQAAGGWSQINHPTIFPSSVPAFAGLCRGCPWDFSDAETAYEQVDSWEVHTGPAGLNQAGSARPGPNPFTLTAIQRWDELRRMGHRITAVAVSDSHNAGRTNNPVTQSPIGQGTTVVYADQLSEEGIERAIRLGRAYVKLWASDDPDLRLDAVTPDGLEAMMGDPLPAAQAKFTARVLGGAKDGHSRELIVMRDGSQIASVPVRGDDFKHEFVARQPGDYRLQLQRGSAIDALTNPITLGVPLAVELRANRRRARAGRRTRFVFHARLRVQDRTVPLRGATVRFRGTRKRTGRAGRARFIKRINRPGRYRAVAKRPRAKRAVVRIKVRRPARARRR